MFLLRVNLFGPLNMANVQFHTFFFQFGPLNIKIQTWQETQWATTVGLLQTPALKSTGRQKHLKILEIIFFFTAAERDLVDQFGNDSKMEKGNLFLFL
jgi:hypothetical protein